MQHPDEGTIHAWLDGALPPGEARALEEHVAGCAECAAAVAEARGLLAASTRILSALDSVPGGVLPAANPEASGMADAKADRLRGSRWRATPWRAAAAIVLVGSVSWLATRGGMGKADNAVTTAAVSDNSVPVTARFDTAAAPVAQRRNEQAPAKTSVAGRVAAATVPPRNPASPKVSARSQAAPGLVEPVAPSVVLQAGMASGNGAAAPASDLAAIEQRIAGKSVEPPEAPSTTMAARKRALEGTTASRPSVVLRGAPTMAATSAPSLMPGGEALQRLVGCYALELSPLPGGAERDEVIAPVLPRRIELLADRAALSDGLREMVLRPAAGEAAFSAGTRGLWQPSGRDTVQIRIVNGRTRVRATLWLTGSDSVRGTTTSAEIRGKKLGCE